MEKKGPILTIAIPVFNAEKYIRKAVESILHQSYKNFELLLIDDGSNDRSGKICDELQGLDERVNVIHQLNKGLVKTREVAIELAKGKYLLFVDADDWIDRDFISSLFIDDNDVDIYIGRYVAEYSNETKKIFSDIKPIIIDRDTSLIYMFQHKIFGWEMCGKIFKIDILRDIKLDNDIMCGEDLLRNWYIFNNAKKIYVSNTCGYHYRQVASSMTSKKIRSIKQTILYPFSCIKDSGIAMDDEVYNSFFLAKLAMTITSLKMMLISSIDDRFKKEITELQKIVRKQIFIMIRGKRLSKAQKYGAVFFCLPYFVCKNLYGLISFYEKRRK